MTRRARGRRPPPGPARRRRRRDARPRGRGPRRRRAPRPGPGARAAGPRPSRPGRSPNAPAGGAPRTTSRRRRAARSPGRPPAPARPGPGRPHARRSTSSSPVSSAAASNSTDCTGSRQPPAPVEEDLLDVSGEVELRRQGLGASELGRGELAGQLQQGQRVAARLDDEPLGHLLGGCVAQVHVEEGAGRVRLEAGQDQFGEPLWVEGLPGAFPGGEHHGRPGPPRAGGRRTGALRRGGVQPMRVVDDAQHEVLLGGGGQQRQGRDAHQERLHRRSVVLAERHPQRPGLRGREAHPAAASAGAAADGARRTPAAPRPRGPGCAAPSPPRPRPRARRAAPTSPRPARHAPPGCRRIRVAPARRALPGVPARAHGRPARVEGTRSRTADPVEPWRFDRGDGGRAQRGFRPCRPAFAGRS